MPRLEISPDFQPYYEIHDATDPWTQAETIVFIHGFAESGKAYYGWIPNLARRFRLITYDLRGLGRNAPVDAGFDYSSDLMAKDAADVIEQLAGGPCHIVAAKSGSIIASRLAVNRPDLVKSLVLACPVGAPTNEDWVGHIEKHGVRSYARSTMPPRLGAGASEACLDWWSDLMGATAASTAYAYFRWVKTTRPVEDLEKLRCPILAIMTTPPTKNDIGAGQLTAANFLSASPRAQVEIVPHDCYHISAVEPDVCARAAEKFIVSLQRT